MFRVLIDGSRPRIHDGVTMQVFGDLSHANFHRTAAIGGADRGNIDPNDSEVVELHRSHLFDPDQHLGIGASVRLCV